MCTSIWLWHRKEALDNISSPFTMLWKYSNPPSKTLKRVYVGTDSFKQGGEERRELGFGTHENERK